MYAIVASGGKQFRVHTGDLISVEARAGEVGDRITFDRVLLVGDSARGTAEIGQPLVKEARVVATITEQGLGDKVRVLRFKRRKRYRKIYGHRQGFTRVRIEEIRPDGKEVKDSAPGTKAAASGKSAKKAAAKTSKKKSAGKATPEAVKPARTAAARKSRKPATGTSSPAGKAQETAPTKTAAKKQAVKKKTTKKAAGTGSGKTAKKGG